MRFHERFGILVFVFALVIGCSKKSTPDFIPDPQGWFIESYDNGTITVQHEGNVYKALCDGSRSFNNRPSAFDPLNVIASPTCNVSIGLVGHNIQPLEGKQKDGDGWTVNMWNAGSILALRRWRDEQTPWIQEEFKISSVKPK
jgi:hypothetical protein